MKRHSALTQLSREHHSALVLAKRALQASKGTPETVNLTAAEVVRVFACDLEPHFQLEEQHLLPALLACGQQEVVERTLAEHAALRALIGQASINQAENLQRFGLLLIEHVRFEERELFPLTESVLNEETFKTLWNDLGGTLNPHTVSDYPIDPSEPAHEAS